MRTSKLVLDKKMFAFPLLRVTKKSDDIFDDMMVRTCIAFKCMLRVFVYHSKNISLRQSCLDLCCGMCARLPPQTMSGVRVKTWEEVENVTFVETMWGLREVLRKRVKMWNEWAGQAENGGVSVDKFCVVYDERGWQRWFILWPSIIQSYFNLFWNGFLGW